MQLFLVLALIIAVFLVIFAVQNSAVVTVTFLSVHTQGSLAFVLIIVFIFGFLAGVLTSLPSIIRKGSALRQERRKTRDLESQLSARQNPPPAK